jgi:hypothetical protein
MARRPCGRVDCSMAQSLPNGNLSDGAAQLQTVKKF